MTNSNSGNFFFGNVVVKGDVVGGNVYNTANPKPRAGNPEPVDHSNDDDSSGNFFGDDCTVIIHGNVVNGDSVKTARAVSTIFDLEAEVVEETFHTPSEKAKPRQEGTSKPRQKAKGVPQNSQEMYDMMRRGKFF